MIRRFIAALLCRMMERSDEKTERGMAMPEGVDVKRDIPVCGGCAFDLYTPHGGGALPLVVDVHGGGLVYGHKGLNARFCASISKLGFAVADIEYRLAPEATFNEMVSDVCRGIKAARRLCPDGKLIIAGDSAGALLALAADAAAAADEVREAFGLTVGDVAEKADGLFLVSGMFVFSRRGVRALAGMPVGRGKWLKYTCMPALLDVYTPPRTLLTSSSSDFLSRATLRFDELLTAHGVPHETDFKQKNANGHKYVHVYPVRHPEWHESQEILLKLRGV